MGLAVFAAVRIALLGAAFPFFANVDEHRHVDVVRKYARGWIPQPGDDAYEPDFPELLALYGSPEYLTARGDVAERGVPAPVWERGGNAPALSEQVRANRAFLENRVNLEAAQPPVAYLVGAAWLALGRALGLAGGQALYWVRALNALLGGALVLVAYAFLRPVYADDAFVRLGVPALLAVFPQDVFFYVNRDALSPLLGGVALFVVARLAGGAERRPAVYVGAGLLLAACALAKTTNAALYVAAAVATAVALGRARGRPPDDAPSPRGIVWRVAALWTAALLPVGLWLARNAVLFGDASGSAKKVARMGWGRKPVSEWLDHPLFTVSGLADFLPELVATFWRGELAWYRETLAHAGADAFYVASSAACVALAATALLRRRPGARRRLEGLALVHVAGSLALLAGLSLAFTFTDTSSPSAARPFFTQGRLVSGALAPFCLLYVRGVEMATGALPTRVARVAAWGALALVAGVALGSEIALSAPVFRSPYNWFHLP